MKPSEIEPPKELTLKFSSATEASPMHPDRNEDSIGYGKDWAAVFDGMGGYVGGRIASNIGLDETRKFLDGDDSPNFSAFDERFAKVVQGAHKRIQEEIRSATTVVVVKFMQTEDGLKAYFLNIGDSRGYFMRDGVLERVTNDDAENQEQTDRLSRFDRAKSPADLSREDRVLWEGRHVTTGIGRGGLAEYEFLMRKLRPGDKIVLTSDGVHDNLTIDEMQEIMSGDGDLARTLLSKAKERSLDEDSYRAKKDDISAIVVEVI